MKTKFKSWWKAIKDTILATASNEPEQYLDADFSEEDDTLCPKCNEVVL